MKEHKIIDVEDRQVRIHYFDRNFESFYEVDSNKTINSLAKEGWIVKQIISKKEEEQSFGFSYGTEVYKTIIYTILFEREGECKNDD